MSDPSGVVDLERALLDTAVRRNRERVAALLHPDFREFGASGRIWDREAIVEALAADPAVDDAATDFSAVALAPAVVLLTYLFGASLRSSVWVRDAGSGWRLLFHQGTPLPG